LLELRSKGHKKMVFTIPDAAIGPSSSSSSSSNVKVPTGMKLGPIKSYLLTKMVMKLAGKKGSKYKRKQKIKLPVAPSSDALVAPSSSGNPAQTAAVSIGPFQTLILAKLLLEKLHRANVQEKKKAKKQVRPSVFWASSLLLTKT
jgi:hypothetical protein